MNNKKENKVLNKIKWIATRGIFIVAYIVLLNVLQASQVFAADDPLTVINNLSNFIFSLTRAIGSIIVVVSLVQIGMAYQSHDPSQKTNGFLTFVGGIIIMFSKEILNIITG